MVAGKIKKPPQRGGWYELGIDIKGSAKRRTPVSSQARSKKRLESEELIWHLHKMHWLRINRRQRSTKNDSLDVLAEVA